LSNVVVGSVEVMVRVVASDVGDAVDLTHHLIGNVEHVIANLIDCHLDFRHIRFDDVLDARLDVSDFRLTRIDDLLKVPIQQALNVTDDVWLIGELKWHAAARDGNEENEISWRKLWQKKNDIAMSSSEGGGAGRREWMLVVLLLRRTWNDELFHTTERSSIIARQDIPQKGCYVHTQKHKSFLLDARKTPGNHYMHKKKLNS